MRHFSWIISLPLMAIAVIFAVNHRQRVDVDLWPLPLEVAPPLYLIVLVGIFVGFAIGGVMTWLSQGKHRRRARQRRYDVERLERKLETVQRELDELRSERGGAAEDSGEARGRLARGNGTAALQGPRTGT